MDLRFQKFFLFLKILFSPQVKQNMIISDKHGIYEFPNYMRPRILED